MATVSSALPGLRKLAGRARGVIRGNVQRSYQKFRHALNWNYLRNPASSRLLATHLPHLSSTQQTAVETLSRQGLTFVQQDALGVAPKDWADLSDLVRGFAASDRVQERIRNFSRDAQSRPLAGDDYMVKFHPEGPTLALDDPLLRVGLSPAILDVVNGYLGLWSKLTYTDAWHTIPVDIGRRVGSQSWHRDPEDRKVVKVYLYLAKVDAGAGPMEYIPGSASGGPYQHLWRWSPKASHHERYPSETELAKLIPPSKWVSCVGDEGTVVICDTNGLHRGGISTTSPRVLATWTFVTPASLGTTVHRRFIVTPARLAQPLSEAAEFALA